MARPVPPTTTLVARSASPPEPPPSTAAAAPAVERGALRLVLIPAATVSIDGSPVGVVSDQEIPLAPGPHVVRIEHPDYEPLQRKLTVHAGLVSRLTLELAEKGIRRQH
jgi:hypothetical protein